jgi:hypothetical protein
VNDDANGEKFSAVLHHQPGWSGEMSNASYQGAGMDHYVTKKVTMFAVGVSIF